jgi:hypothetical protein
MKQANPTKALTLGAHASSVRAPATNQPARGNKARKSLTPALSSGHHVTYNRSAVTAVTPLVNSGPSPDGTSNRDLFLANAPTLNRDDITAVSRLHISRRNEVCFHPWPRAVLAFHKCNPFFRNEPSGQGLGNLDRKVFDNLVLCAGEIPAPLDARGDWRTTAIQH